jgi:hypothetical protein
MSAAAAHELAFFETYGRRTARNLAHRIRFTLTRSSASIGISFVPDHDNDRSTQQRAQGLDTIDKCRRVAPVERQLFPAQGGG